VFWCILSGIFTERRYASAVCAVGRVSVRPSVCSSVVDCGKQWKLGAHIPFLTNVGSSAFPVAAAQI